ncbi:amidohydrolase [Wenxinia marina]|uniref:Putative metal-dependent hydrolase with the TIM-barrel fold protein n=1 Tax=Wenxinia marina DSM 24838 TaxID=1123501 RepID=A0A0D0QBF5_9RHOB|nr:amidohydrolase [Wenxinia marina]KIQ68248.1 putative metal-dependent hydrolase with the TIM-barrel fold protein [Wenxinia marina DSM 24838]GGL77077.1 hydrolase [Wenxinia marina]
MDRVATIVVRNGRVLTMDAAAPRAEAVALAGDRVIACGSDAEVAALAGPSCRIVDAGGATVLPGFVESHLHLFMGGAELSHLQLLGVEGPEALGRALRAFAEAHPDLALLTGQGCDYAIYGRALTRHDLDAILPDRPVLLIAADHHTGWANTAALRAAGILEGRRLGPGNEIVMGEDGIATGELREFEAKAPVLALSGGQRVQAGIATGGEPDPAPTRDQLLEDCEHMARGLRHCARHGLTSLVNMDGNRYTLEVLSELRDRGDLTARVRVPFHYRNHREPPDLEIASGMARDWNDDWLSSGFVKMFMDGVIDSGTAVRLDDYPGRPGWRGEPLFTPEAFAAACIEADRRGLQIAVHAIGDGAVRRVLDGYAAARGANGPRDSRHRVEHIEMIDRADIPRMVEMGVIGSLQPCHVPGALDFPLQPTLDVIGRGRWGDAYLYRTLAEAGVRLAFATDWPVADVNPLRCIQAALTRPVFDGAGDERLALMDVLAGYTIGGAFAEHTEDRKGMLRPGHLADLVILDGDIEETAPAEIGGMSVAMTICGGRIVWDSAAEASA